MEPVQLFAEVDDVKKAIKVSEIVGLILDTAGRADEQVNSDELNAIVQEAIEYASGQMIPLLRKYDSLPLTTTDPALKGDCVDIALWWLMDRSPKRGKDNRNPFEKRKDDAFKRLEMRLIHRLHNNEVTSHQNIMVSTSSDIDEDYTRDYMRENWS
jgi:phage gp36-like protein